MSNSTNKLKSQLAVRVYQNDPADASVATKGAWVPMAEHFMAVITVRTGALVTAKIFAATDSSGSNATEVKAASNPTTADAKDDQRVIEVSAEDVLAALPAATHVAVEIDMNGATDDCAVAYVRKGLRFTTADMTADVTS